MKIAHVTDFYLPRLGGIETQVAELAGRQAQAGHTVHVLTSSPGPDDGVAVRLSGDLRWPHALHPLATRAGIHAIALGAYDVVHAHVGVGSPLAFFGARAAVRAGTPTVVTVHSLWYGVRPVMQAFDAWGRWSRLPIAWTAVSQAAAEPVRRLIPAERPIHVIPNGIDQHYWRHPNRVATPDRHVVLASVMRLSVRKRPMPLLHMFRHARERLGRDAGLRLNLAGDGPLGRRIAGYVRRHGLADVVNVHGRLDRDQVREMLARSSVYVAPANLESFGIAALEARCAGLPVVAQASGGVGEFIGDGREGVLCAGDHEMVDAIVRLVRDEGLREQIAAHNRTSPCPVSWEAVLERTEAVYREAMSNQRPDARGASAT